MKIHPIRNRAMTLVSAIIMLTLFALFIAGVCYLCCKLRDCFDGIDRRQRQKEHEAGAFTALELSIEDQVTMSNILASAEPTVTLSNLVYGQTFRVVVEFSTNLANWEPYTNYTATFGEWDLKLPQQPERGPMGFYQITTRAP